MKTLKSVWDMLPLHYWTGIFGGVIYVAWVGISFYLQEHWHYSGQNLLVYVFIMMQLPTIFHNWIFDPLIEQVNDTGNWRSANIVGYHYLGYILPGIFFVLVGMVVGKTSTDPQREAIRRRVIILLFGIAIIVFICWASYLIFAYSA
jgi:hypothetical protein